MKALFLALALLIGFSGAAEAGPIAAAVAAISSWTVAGVAVGSMLLNMAVSVAMSALSRALAKKPEAAGLRTETTLNGEATPGSLIFGRYATAGFMVAPPMTAGSAGGMPNGFLTYVIEVADARVDGLDGVWINDDKVELLAPAAGDMYPDHQRAGGKFAGRAWFKFFDGTQTTAATANLSAAGGTAAGRPWQSDMIGRGVAYAIARFRFDREVFSGFPQVLFEVRGLRLYDPRKDSTVGGSGAHRWGQPGTYEWTENPAVMVYNILRGIALDDGLTWGGDCAAEDLPVANWFAAMNECDVLVDGEPQYRAGYEVRIGPEHLGGDEPAGVIDELLRGCAGQITEYGGVYKIRVGGPGMPVTAFSDDDIIITQTQHFEPFPPLDQVYNAVQAQHPEPAERWASKEAPPRFRSDYAAEDGQVNVAALRLPSVTRGSQAQRIMRAYLEEERRFRRHDISLPPDFARVEPLDAVAWTSSRNGYSAKVFEVTSQADDQTTLIQRFGLRERDPSDYDWAPGMALPVAIGQPGTPVPPARQVLGFAVAPYVIIDDAGGPRRAGIILTWNGDQPDARAVQWQIRPQGQTELVAQGSIHDVAAGQMVTSEGLSPNTGYEVRARLAMDAATEWTAWLPVTTPDVRINAALEVDLAVTQAEIDAAEAEALAASQAAANALSAANAALDYTDAEVAAARADLGANILDTVTLISRAGGVIADPFLVGGWSRWSAEGSLTRVPNEVYPTGETWDFTVTNAQNDGLQIVSTDNTWPGQTDAAGYVVEMEYTLVSGSLSGAGFYFRWSSGTDYDVAVPLSAAQAGVGVSGKTRTARFVAKKPSNFAGTFASNRFYFFCNMGIAAFGARAAKRIKVHRINIRVATEEELGRGEVMAEVQATLTQSYLTSAQTNSAISSSITSYDASLAELKSNVTNTATALAGTRNAIASFQYLATTGSGGSAGIRAVSITPDGTTTQTGSSTLTLVGDNVIAPGTLSTNALVVGLGKNLMVDPEFVDGTAHYMFSHNSDSALSAGIRNPGGFGSHPGSPTLFISQTGTTSNNAYWMQRPMDANGSPLVGLPVKPGQHYILSASLRDSGAGGPMSRLYIYWYDATESIVGQTAGSYTNHGGDAYDPTSWTRDFVKGQAPATAAYARPMFQKEASGSGTALYIWRPQFEECHPEATQPSPWSPGGTTYINGGRLFADSVTAREVATETLTATHMVKTAALITATAQIANGIVENAKIANAAIGTAKIADLAVERIKIGDNAVTITHSISRNTTGNAEITFNMVAPGRVLFGFSGNVGASSEVDASSTGDGYEYRLYFDTTYAVRIDAPVLARHPDTGLPRYTNTGMTIMHSISAGAGNHTVSFRDNVSIAQSKVGTVFALVTYK